MKPTNQPLTAQTTVNQPIEPVWKFWTTPENIMEWNVPDGDWQTTKVENDVRDGGEFLYRMETKDGTQHFDYKGKYDKVILHERIDSTLFDGRKVSNTFISNGNETTLTEIFDPESETPIDIQKEFCQGVLDTFKKYAEQKKVVEQSGFSIPEENVPFVNEECGDTMWDEVLKESEERISKTFAPKPGDNSSKMTDREAD
jgi:uncharacterized protein YndB with AHSA1/START domain